MGMFDNIFNKSKVIKADNTGNVFNYKFEQGIDCDSIPNSYGEFGRTPTNPIPVNGPKGEVLYLSRLRTMNNRPFFFHRLTSSKIANLEEEVDMFEIVSVDNQIWDVLYFHMYHPRLSNSLPTNFTVKDDEVFSKIAVGLGSCSFINNFPNGVSAVLNETYNYGADFNSIAQQYLDLYTFIRPQEHTIKLLQANNIGSYFNKLIQSTSTEYGINYFMNFLVSPIPQAHIYALKALANQYNYSDELFKSLGNFCLKMKDASYTNLAIDVIKKVKPDDHEYYGAWTKMLDVAPMADAVRNMVSAAFIKEEDFLPVSIPYLIMTANHPNANTNLINFCSQIADEITYR